MNEDNAQRVEQTPSGSEKKLYRKPQLVEWGSVVDLTRGGFAGYTDATSGASDPLFRPSDPRR